MGDRPKAGRSATLTKNKNSVLFGKKEKRRRRVIKTNYGNNKLERYAKRRKIQASLLGGLTSYSGLKVQIP